MWMAGLMNKPSIEFSQFHKLSIKHLGLANLHFLETLDSEDLYYDTSIHTCVVVDRGSMVTSPIHISEKSKVPGIRRIYELVAKRK